MDYFDVLFNDSSAVYQEVDDQGVFRYTDALGNTVAPPSEPVKYVLRSWCVNRPAWMEQIAGV